MNSNEADKRQVTIEDVLKSENLMAAYRAVKANAGAPGVDGMTVGQLAPHLREHWEGIASKLRQGSYRPAPVRAMEIPKPNGGVRTLGIPTVLDRLVQQAILQCLSPVFDPDFSLHSYGFRPGRSAHDAVRAARGYVQASSLSD